MRLLTLNKILFGAAMLLGLSLPNVQEYPATRQSLMPKHHVPGKLTDTPYDTAANYPGYKLVWSEDFSGPLLDTSAWSFEIGNGCPKLCGFGNNELQFYRAVPENVAIEDGKLIITARQQANSNAYTSARIHTKNKKFFNFGRIDMRARLPFGKGIWPAFWMMPQDANRLGWPMAGEIDIMEMVGHEPATTHGTLHFGPGPGSTQLTGQHKLKSGTFNDAFHIFSLEWKKDTLTWLLDGKAFEQHTRSEAEPAAYPFNEEFYLILNLAVGGKWPGNPDHTTRFPQSFIVDYVRVYQ